MTTRLAVIGLRLFLVVLFGLLVLLQAFSLPGQFAYMAEQDPDSAHLRWPFTIVAGLLLTCGQVVVVAIWQLLSRVAAGRIFDDASFVWVTTIIAAIGAAWLVMFGVGVYVAGVADDPGVPLVVFSTMVGITVIGLLMIVMRALLKQATALHTDLEAVI